MKGTPQQAHQRFQQQSRWTEQLRSYFFTRLKPGPSARILEVGCGTGAITSSLSGYTQAGLYGLDFNLDYLHIAASENSNTRLIAGDALRLPFADHTFDAVYCHFFLLWIKLPQKAVAEMVRVCRSGGAVIAFAEPDYGGRIDYPEDLAYVGQMQTQALQNQGANPFSGRRLSELFHQSGLIQIESGVLGGQWNAPPSPSDWESEWATLESDLEGMISQEQLNQLRALDAKAWRLGQRVLFVPTFYAMGIKP